MSSDPFYLSRVVCLLITYILETMFENNFIYSVEWIKDCLVLSKKLYYQSTCCFDAYMYTQFNSTTTVVWQIR